MASQPGSGSRAERPAAHKAAMGSLQKASAIAGLAAIIGVGSVRNAAAATMLMVAGPLTAAGFVYEVQAMRKAQLTHEAADRIQYAAYLADKANAANDRDYVTASIAKTDDDGSLGLKIAAMIKSRSVLLDTFGDEASTVAPVYATIIKQMLRDDEDAFATFADKRMSVSKAEATTLAEQVGVLHELHAKLTHLAGG
ncbi:MAG: hypothetical protein ABSA13_07805 [Beijerinckiaceae bacterium]|jgi:hypothetical protein